MTLGSPLKRKLDHGGTLKVKKIDVAYNRVGCRMKAAV